MVDMRWLLSVVLLLTVLVQDIVCPPVKAQKDEKEEPEAKPEEDVNFGLEYERYLKEVVSILETDEVFKKKLEDSNISDIKSGEIARHLELVSHNVRTKLDELKRQELDRLRQIQRLNMRRQNAIKHPSRKGLPLKDMTEVNRLVAHLDHNNPHTFEVEDLSKLIKQATDDLELLDKQRKDEFKVYEMEKEHLHKKKMEALDDVHRKQEEKTWEEQKEKHRDHPKLHHPGSKDQLKEVWEESDGLAKDDFEPKTFFMLHDTNGDGLLDPVEVEALFQKELDKIYDPNAPEDDMMERYEEMNRMREHIMKEVDTDHDSFITLEEFLKSTTGDDFNKDEGWKTLEDEEVFTEDELTKFEKDYEERRGQEYEGHEQPGEINLGAPPPSFIPPHDEPADHPVDPAANVPPSVPEPIQGGQGAHHDQGQGHVVDPNVVQPHQDPPATAFQQQPVEAAHQAIPEHHQAPAVQQQQHHEQPKQQQLPDGAHQQQPPAVPQNQQPPNIQHHEQPVQQHHEQPVQQHHEQPVQQHHEQPVQQHPNQPADAPVHHQVVQEQKPVMHMQQQAPQPADNGQQVPPK